MSVAAGVKHILFNDFAFIYRMMPPDIKRCILFVFFLMGILATLEACSILSISFLALSVAAPEKVMTLPGMAWILEHFPSVRLLGSDMRMFSFWISALVAALIMAKNIVSGLVTMRSSILGERVALHAGDTFLRYCLNSPYLACLAGKMSSIFTIISWRSQLGFFLVNLMQVYTYMATSVVLFFVLVSATPTVLILVLGIIGILCLAIYRGLKRSVDNASQQSAICSNEESHAVENAKHGMLEIHLYRQQAAFFNAFHNAGKAAMPSRAFVTSSPPLPAYILESIAFLVIPATLWIMVRFHDAPMARITAVLTMIMLASWRILPLLNRSMTNLVALRGAYFPMRRCLEELERIGSDPIPEEPEITERLPLQSDIVFDNVSFRYPSARTDCLSGVSFRLKKGESLGIIGQSGSGKSSLANILCGLIDPTAGEMRVDGKRLEPQEQIAYRLGVGYVTQAPYLLQGTLAQNVAFAQWGRPYDADRVLRACRMAHLDIVDTHPEGIELPIGEGGTGLSGGQAQRLSIARALYMSPDLLLLDEATSSLDLGIETAIMQTIVSISRSVTTVVIAHRLSTVEWCDNVLWLKNGKVADYGKPENVIPRYREYLLNVKSS